MELFIWAIILGIIILSDYMMNLHNQTDKGRRIIDEKTLEESVKKASQYEIAYLKGNKKEVFKLAFYTLIKSGYLIQKEKKDSRLKTARIYYLGKSKNLDVLHVIEQAVALASEDEKLLSVDLQKQVKAIFGEYNKKIEGLYLKHITGGLWGCLLILIIFFCPFIFYGIFKNKLNTYIMLAMSVVAFLVLPKIMWRSSGLTSNGKRYIELFEKIHFPYPDMNSMFIDNKMDFGGYIAIVTPCSI